jgi:hypothetical protein
MRGFRSFFVVVACPLMLVAGGCGGDGGDEASSTLPAGVAAKVDNTVIREPAVQAQMAATRYERSNEKLRSYGPPDYPACVKAKRALNRPGETEKSIRAQCKFEYEVGRAQAVNTLLRAQWLSREIKRRGLSSDEIIQKASARAMKFWAKAPGKAPDFSKDLSFVMEAQYQALSTATPATEKEIQEYGAANAEVYYQGEDRRAQIAQNTTKAQATKARQALDRGMSWPEVQKRYALKPVPGRWTGHLTVTEHTIPSDAFGRAVFSARQGQVIGPVHTINGWFVFEVTKINPPRYKRLSPQAHYTVETNVRAQKLEAILNRRYAQLSSCAKKYIIPEAPNCR